MEQDESLVVTLSKPSEGSKQGRARLNHKGAACRSGKEVLLLCLEEKIRKERF